VSGRCLVCKHGSHVINIPKADWSSVKNKQLGDEKQAYIYWVRPFYGVLATPTTSPCPLHGAGHPRSVSVVIEGPHIPRFHLISPNSPKPPL